MACLLFLAAMPALAQQKSQEEKNLEKAAVELEKEAGGGGADAVAGRLKAEFGVDDARIEGLRGQKLGYGEVGIVLSLAQGMPGGIDDANVQKIMALRQGPPVMGWGKIAKELGLKLGPAVSKVKKASAEARKEKAAGKAAMGKEHSGGKGDKMERRERPEKQERPGKPEMGGKR